MSDRRLARDADASAPVPRSRVELAEDLSSSSAAVSAPAYLATARAASTRRAYRAD